MASKPSVLEYAAGGALAGVEATGASANGTPWPAPAPLQGALYAAAVWALSYRGWVPALGIMPPPERDRPGRPTTMFVLHLVYGAKLGSSLQARST